MKKRLSKYTFTLLMCSLENPWNKDKQLLTTAGRAVLKRNRVYHMNNLKRPPRATRRAGQAGLWFLKEDRSLKLAGYLCVCVTRDMVTRVIWPSYCGQP